LSCEGIGDAGLNLLCPPLGEDEDEEEEEEEKEKETYGAGHVRSSLRKEG